MFAGLQKENEELRRLEDELFKTESISSLKEMQNRVPEANLPTGYVTVHVTRIQHFHLCLMQRVWKMLIEFLDLLAYVMICL